MKPYTQTPPTTSSTPWWLWAIGGLALGAGAFFGARYLARVSSEEDPWREDAEPLRALKDPEGVVYTVLPNVREDDEGYVESEYDVLIHDYAFVDGNEMSGEGLREVRSFETKEDARAWAKSEAKKARSSGRYKAVLVEGARASGDTLVSAT